MNSLKTTLLLSIAISLFVLALGHRLNKQDEFIIALTDEAIKTRISLTNLQSRVSKLEMNMDKSVQLHEATVQTLQTMNK